VGATDIEIATLIEGLRRHYPAQPLDADGWGDWYDDFADVPPDIIAAACRDWRRSDNRWAPTPGQLLALCVDAKIRKHLSRRAEEAITLLEAK
jgi:hypothetical protein